MAISVRPPITVLPSYSLTSDLLGFLRCGLQYRYTRIGNLPSSHPVQLWFGQFIHAVLEEAYREVNDNGKPLPPWKQDDIDKIMDRIDRRLVAQNIRCWDDKSRDLGRKRATAAVNELGPVLFPLINQAEVRVRGARKLPPSLKGLIQKDIERYEMLGVIDIVTQIELFSPKARGNKLIELVVEDLPRDPPQEFEVIVDYKGMKRPENAGVGKKMLQIYDWQVHTYAHLRSTLTTKPIIAGVLIYLNELVPTKTDFYDLRRAVKEKQKGIIVPEPDSGDEQTLLKWKPANKDDQPPLLSIDFRLTRAIRVVPISDASKKRSLKEFDDTVARIEQCIAKESQTGRVIASWEKNNSSEKNCEACDAKTYCPAYNRIKNPRLPRVKK